MITGKKYFYIREKKYKDKLEKVTIVNKKKHHLRIPDVSSLQWVIGEEKYRDNIVAHFIIPAWLVIVDNPMLIICRCVPAAVLESQITYQITIMVKSSLNIRWGISVKNPIYATCKLISLSFDTISLVCM